MLALLGPLIGLVVGAAGVLAVTDFWGPRVAGEEAVDRAEAIVAAIADGTVAPLVTADLLNGDATAYRRLHEAMQVHTRDGTIGQVKVWNADGRIVYAVETSLVGRRVPLNDEHHRTLQSGGSEAALATVLTEQAVAEQALGHVHVTAFAGFRGADGELYLLEAYHRGPLFRDAEMQLVQQLTLLVLLVAGALFYVPSAYFLSGRLKRFRTDRKALVARVSSASHTERRRLAQALHDDVVQDLAGLGYALSSTVAHLPERADQGAQSMLRTADGLVHRSIGRLREILDDIYPLDVELTDLAGAVDELAEPLRQHGVRVNVQFQGEQGLEPETKTMIFRLTRELLRNIDRHARAESVAVRVERVADDVVVSVADDGIGFDTSVLETPAPGHVGLVILVDAVTDRGGSFRLSSEPGRGCRVMAVLPARATDGQRTATIG